MCLCKWLGGTSDRLLASSFLQFHSVAPQEICGNKGCIYFIPVTALCLKRFRQDMWQSLFEKQSIMCFQFINYKIFKSTANTKELVTARYLELLSLSFSYLLAFSSPPLHHEEQNANKMQMKPLRPERIRRKTSVPKRERKWGSLWMLIKQVV